MNIKDILKKHTAWLNGETGGEKANLVDNFDENRWNECAAGIHFFITREEAVRY